MAMPLHMDDESDSDLSLDTDDLAATIVHEIESGTYTCLVCTFEIDSSLQVWTCDNCYRVYDLECIKDWAVRGSSTVESGKARAWRCPSCNVAHKKVPLEFRCWCGRVRNPAAGPFPFSCGGSCGAPLECVHVCGLVCHPGPHPRCGAVGPVTRCLCGKHTQQVPCIMTPYAGWRCSDPCGVQLCPRGHTCRKGCHAGFCGRCTENVTVECYCGKHEVQVACADIVPRGAGGAACGETSVEYYACGLHWEEVPCQPRRPARPCKYSPETVKTCWCGKTPSGARALCADPMPACGEVCGKALPCGCVCRAQCHAGPCECHAVRDARCRCGMQLFAVPCKAVQQGFEPVCRRKCTARLSCKRHTHGAVCCALEPQAVRRERAERLRRTRPLFEETVLAVEPEHVCTRVCGQLRACGVHRCTAVCHLGPCGVCLEASNDDLVCPCGSTVVPAPVRCGTTVKCTHPCVKTRPCGHPQLPHPCHEGDCPRCTARTTKRCNCGAKEIPGILCLVSAVSCGTLCTEKLPCGHPCNVPCARACVEGTHNQGKCQFVCRRVRGTCPHLCPLKCHKGTCDTAPCPRQVSLRCPCGRLQETRVCGASTTSPTAIGVLECNDECAKAQRDAELRRIFAVEPEQSAYPELVLSVYRRQHNWCLKMEAVMRGFVGGEKPSLHFPPMPRPQRLFLNDLAGVLGLYSELQGVEPQRAVFVHRLATAQVPQDTIEQALDKEEERRRQQQQREELEQTRLNEAFFNAIVIQDVFFGVSAEKVQLLVMALVDELAEPQVHWLKDSTFVYFDKHLRSMDKEKENQLYMLLKTFKKVLRDKLVAFNCRMCLIQDLLGDILKYDSRNFAFDE